MYTSINKSHAAIIIAAAALLLSLCACKGRRASDMVPSGDTVEVVVNPSATEDINPDSLQINDSIRHEI